MVRNRPTGDIRLGQNRIKRLSTKRIKHISPLIGDNGSKKKFNMVSVRFATIFFCCLSDSLGVGCETFFYSLFPFVCVLFSFYSDCL